MAIYGCKHPVFAPITTYTAGTLPTYGDVINGSDAGKITKVDITVNRSDAKLSGDNVICERDNSVTGGSVSPTLTTITDEIKEKVLGYVKKTNAYAMGDASAPQVGFGCVLNEIVDGTKSYIGVWVYRVQFSGGSLSAETKGDSINFQTHDLTGEMLDVEDSTGKWFFVMQNFNTESAAIAFVNGKGVISGT